MLYYLLDSIGFGVSTVLLLIISRIKDFSMSEVKAFGCQTEEVMLTKFMLEMIQRKSVFISGISLTLTVHRSALEGKGAIFSHPDKSR